MLVAAEPLLRGVGLLAGVNLSSLCSGRHFFLDTEAIESAARNRVSVYLGELVGVIIPDGLLPMPELRWGSPGGESEMLADAFDLARVMDERFNLHR